MNWLRLNVLTSTSIETVCFLDKKWKTDCIRMWKFIMFSISISQQAWSVNLLHLGKKKHEK